MTTYERYAFLLAVLQLVASGLGFIVVVWSLRVLIRTLDAQASAGVAARQLEFDKTILTHPVLYEYFYQHRELTPNDPEHDRVMAATHLLANYFDGYFQQQGKYRQMWSDEAWKRYIQGHVDKSPVLRSHVSANPGWFCSEFVEMCREAGAQGRR